MGRSQETFGKKEKEKKRQKKREEKEKKRLERKENSPGGGLENMIAYVDEYGNITDTPPDEDAKKKAVVKAEDIVLGIPQKGEEDPADLIHEGKVTFFNDSKGYGFIRDLKDQESYFVHVNGLKEDVTEGDKVSFELEKGQKGLMAVRVKKV